MSTTAWWILGFAVAGAVVVIAAGLLIAIILLARRIVTQTAQIAYALDQARINTEPLFEIASVNHAIESITRGLQKVRGEPKGIEDERSVLQRARSRLPGGGGGS